MKAQKNRQTMAYNKSVYIYCIFCLVFVSSALAIVITLTYVGVEPRFYIERIYVPALNNSINSANLTSSIAIHLKFKRVVAFAPLRYEDLYITVYNGSHRSFSMGYYVIPGFYQGRKKTVRRKVVLEARGPPWEDALRTISRGSTAVLVVELATKYRLRECVGGGDCSYTKAKTVVVAADVAVDGSGVEIFKKPIRLH